MRACQVACAAGRWLDHPGSNAVAVSLAAWAGVGDEQGLAPVGLLQVAGDALPRGLLRRSFGHQLGPGCVAARRGVVGAGAGVLQDLVGEARRPEPVHGRAELLLGAACPAVASFPTAGLAVRVVPGVVADLALEVQLPTSPSL